MNRTHRLTFTLLCLAVVTRCGIAGAAGSEEQTIRSTPAAPDVLRLAFWNSSIGPWSDPARWSGGVVPNNGTPAASDTYNAIIFGGVATLDQNVTISGLALGNSAIGGANSLSVASGMNLSNGTLGGGGSLNLLTGSSSTISGPATLAGRTINNSGALSIAATVEVGAAGVGVATTFNNLGPGTINLQKGSGFFDGGAGLTIANAGTINVHDFVNIDAQLVNSGTLNVASGGTAVLGGGGTHTGFIVLNDTFVTISGNSSPFVLGDQSTITGPGSLLVGGDAEVSGLAKVTDRVVVGLKTLEILNGAELRVGELIVAGGTTRLSHGDIRILGTAPLQVANGGTLTGSGAVIGNLTCEGTFAPRNIGVAGSFALPAAGRWQAQLGGTDLGIGYDFADVGGTAVLGGELAISFRDGFAAAVSPMHEFTILQAGDISGSFSNAPNGKRVQTTDGYGSFQITYSSHANSVRLHSFVPNTRWLGGAGNWATGSNWTSAPAFPHNQGDTTYFASIQSGSVNLDQSITVDGLFLAGDLAGEHNLAVSKEFTWRAGRLGNGGGLALGASASGTAHGPLKLSGRRLTNSGTLRMLGEFSVEDAAAGGANTTVENRFNALLRLEQNSYWHGGDGTRLTLLNSGDIRVVDSAYIEGVYDLRPGGGMSVAAGQTLTLWGRGEIAGGFRLEGSNVSFSYSPSVPGSFQWRDPMTIVGTGDTLIDAPVNVSADVTVEDRLIVNGGILQLRHLRTMTVGRFVLEGAAALEATLLVDTVPANPSLITSNGLAVASGELRIDAPFAYRRTGPSHSKYVIITSPSAIGGTLTNVVGGRITSLHGYGTFAVSYPDSGRRLEISDFQATPLNYAMWLTTFPNNGGDSSFTGDIDGDGLSNGVEYALGGSLVTPDAHRAPTSTIVQLPGSAARYLALTYDRPRGVNKPADLSWKVQRSLDLTNAESWSGEGLATEQVSPLSSEMERVVVRSLTPIGLGEAPREFLRLFVVQNAAAPR